MEIWLGEAVEPHRLVAVAFDLRANDVLGQRPLAPEEAGVVIGPSVASAAASREA